MSLQTCSRSPLSPSPSTVCPLVTLLSIKVKDGRWTDPYQVREFVPNVIEPSFGLGRILYSLLEHSYWAREQDKARGVLSFPPLVAPIKCLIVTISQDPTLRGLIHEICKSTALRRAMFIRSKNGSWLTR